LRLKNGLISRPQAGYDQSEHEDNQQSLLSHTTLKKAIAHGPNAPKEILFKRVFYLEKTFKLLSHPKNIDFDCNAADQTTNESFPRSLALGC
jgi:hypothetical protein